MTFVLLLVTSILGAVAVATAVTVSVARRRGEARVRAQLAGVTVIRQSPANSFGRRSLRPWQIRGMGTLALTPDELRFVGWAGVRDIAIPRSSMTTVDVARSHLGKTAFRDLLRVSWRDADGAVDSAAWLVPDLQSWLAALGR